MEEAKTMEEVAEGAARVAGEYASLFATKGLYIEKEETKGRCVRTSRAIAAGTELFADEPYVATLKQVDIRKINCIDEKVSL